MFKLFKHLWNDFIQSRLEFKERAEQHRERIKLAKKEFDEQHQRVLTSMRKPL